MISIVIPVHNRKTFTRNCLVSLKNQTLPADFVIVVDDGSTDGTDELLRDEFPEVIVLKGDGNLFWTASINVGIKKALRLGSDYILTLNNDTIASPHLLEGMIKAAEQNPCALFGALDIDATSGKPYYGGEIFCWENGSSEFLLDVLPEHQQHGLREVSLFPARGLFIPRCVFETIGLFEEEQLPHYMADYDFTLMAIRHGFKVYCNYEVWIYTYPEEGGDHKIRKQKTIRNYFRHLFDIKGGGNLVNYTVYTLRNCPRKYIFFALLTGFARRLAGFWMK